jgi:hypothetical protein
MPEYVRPPLPKRVYHDANGAVIDYGNRWRGGAPPEDTYSVVSNPQRFAPLQAVAEALIEHLRQSYAVSVTEDIAVAADLMHAHDAVLRAVRIVPDKADAAPLTFIFTAFPGVIVHAGLLHDFPFPQCGCDACDDSLEVEAGEMERLVFAVVAGGFSETVRPGPWPHVGHRLVDPDGTYRGSGQTLATGYPDDRIEAAEAKLRSLPKGWQPWQPVRSP